MKINAEIPSYDSKEFQKKFIANNDPVFGRNETIKIIKIEDVINYLKFPFPLHRTNYYDIMFIVEGQSSSKHCGLKKYEIRPSQIFFKAAGQITSGDVLDKNIKGYFCLVEGDFLSNYGFAKSPLSNFSFFKFGNNPIISLDATEISRIVFLLDNMHRLYNSGQKDETRYPIIAAYLNVLLQEAAIIHQNQNKSEFNAGSATSAEVITDKFKDLVAEHYLTKRQVKEYADLLCITPNHLNKVIKKATGKTALDLIFEMLLMEAQVLLKQTDMNIAEIANYLRFEDTSYFSRFFKKHSGVTPVAYRKME
jgi:AraC family transcriptional activator of pobA